MPENNLPIVEEILAVDRQGRLFSEECVVRHELSERARAGLERLIDGGLDQRVQVATDLSGQLDQVTHDLEAVKRSLAATPKEDAIKDIALRLKQKAKEAGALNDRVVRMRKELDRAKNEKADAEKRLNKLNKELLKGGDFKAEEFVRMAELAGKTQEPTHELFTGCSQQLDQGVSRGVADEKAAWGAVGEKNGESNALLAQQLTPACEKRTRIRRGKASLSCKRRDLI